MTWSKDRVEFYRTGTGWVLLADITMMDRIEVNHENVLVNTFDWQLERKFRITCACLLKHTCSIQSYQNYCFSWFDELLGIGATSLSHPKRRQTTSPASTSTGTTVSLRKIEQPASPNPKIGDYPKTISSLQSPSHNFYLLRVSNLFEATTTKKESSVSLSDIFLTNNKLSR